LWQGLAVGQISIRLTGVPDRLTFPLPEGVNLVLTATIKGGEARSVWLAPNATSSSSRRVMLTKVDDGEYRINLAGREVHDLLKPHGADGEFRIFAKTADGTTIQSISVAYTMRVVPERWVFPGMRRR